MFESMIRFALQRWERQLRPKYDNFCEMLSEYARRPCTLGILGLQSAGKTTLINACLGYPILPALLTKGTVCPMRVEWGEQPSLTVRMRRRERKWEVRISEQMMAQAPEQMPGQIAEQAPERMPEQTLEQAPEQMSEQILEQAPKQAPKQISDQILGQIYAQLLEYVCLCVNLAVFYPENLSYFLEEEKSPGALTPQDILMDPRDIRHVLVLVLIVLNAHVETASPACGALKLQPVKEARQRLLKLLGLDAGEIESLCLSWNSPLLKEGLCLVDLPGLGSGSMAVGEHDALGEIACDWAKHMDILLCMTTKEVVGGQMQQVLEKIYADGSPEKKPLPVLVVNRAEEIVNPAIVIHTAQQLLWPLLPPCYLISAAAGEYRYLEEGIPVKRTRYWRNIFLPEYRSEPSAAEAPGSAEAQVGKRLTEAEIKAEKRLSRCYARKYDCVGANGDIFSIALKEFLDKVLPDLVTEQARDNFCNACQGYPDAANLLKRLTEKDMGSLSAILGDLHTLWGDFYERAAYAIARFQETCSAAEQQMRRTCMEFREEMLLFQDSLGLAVQELNHSFSQEIISVGTESKQHFGILVCKADSLFHTCDTFEYAPFFLPALRSYEETFRKAAARIEQTEESIRSAFNLFQDEFSGLPLFFRKKCEDLGYKESLIERCFISRIQEYVKQGITQCGEIFPGGQGDFPKKSAHIDFEWGSHSGALVGDAIREAAVVQWGKDRRRTLFLKKKKLQEALSKPLISEALAESQFRKPFRSEAEEVQRRLDQKWYEYETFRATLEQKASHWKSQAEKAELDSRLEMEGDLNALQEWDRFASFF